MGIQIVQLRDLSIELSKIKLSFFKNLEDEFELKTYN